MTQRQPGSPDPSHATGERAESFGTASVVRAGHALVWSVIPIGVALTLAFRH